MTDFIVGISKLGYYSLSNLEFMRRSNKMTYPFCSLVVFSKCDGSGSANGRINWQIGGRELDTNQESDRS